MSDIVVIGGGFGGTWFAKATGALLLTRSLGDDLNTDIGKILVRIKFGRFRYVVNFASQSMVGQSWERPSDWMQTNVVAQTKLIQGLAKIPSIERYIHFTTPEVYGSTNGWVKENWSFNPSTPYAVSRAAGDWMVKLWHQQYGFPAIFTRAANIYGEGQQLYRVIPKAVLAKMEGKPFPLEGAGTSVRSFVHMDDVTAALRLLLECGESGETYHIGPAEKSQCSAVTIHNVAAMVGCETVDVPERPGKDQRYLLDSSKIMDMGWSPRVSLHDGIGRVRRWMRGNHTTWATWPREYEHRA